METRMSTRDDAGFETFRAFYPYYLREHSDINCRRLHFLGTALVISTAVYAFATRTWWLMLLLPVFGYSFAWVGHYVFERNQPATFKYPFYSLAGDFVMFRDLLVGKVRM
jgi:hypothetical protein